MKTKETKEPQLLVDSHHGIYIPQIFCQTYNVESNFENYQEIKEDIEELAKKDSQENEHYFDTWDQLLNKAVLLLDGEKWYIDYFDSDLFAFPEGYEREEF